MKYSENQDEDGQPTLQVAETNVEMDSGEKSD